MSRQTLTWSSAVRVLVDLLVLVLVSAHVDGDRRRRSRPHAHCGSSTGRKSASKPQTHSPRSTRSKARSHGPSVRSTASSLAAPKTICRVARRSRSFTSGSRDVVRARRSGVSSAMRDRPYCSIGKRARSWNSGAARWSSRMPMVSGGYSAPVTKGSQTSTRPASWRRRSPRGSGRTALALAMVENHRADATRVWNWSMTSLMGRTGSTWRGSLGVPGNASAKQLIVVVVVGLGADACDHEHEQVNEHAYADDYVRLRQRTPTPTPTPTTTRPRWLAFGLPFF